MCAYGYIYVIRIYCTFTQTRAFMQTFYVCFSITHPDYIYSPLDAHFDTSA